MYFVSTESAPSDARSTSNTPMPAPPTFVFLHLDEFSHPLALSQVLLHSNGMVMWVTESGKLRLHEQLWYLKDGPWSSSQKAGKGKNSFILSN